GTSKGAAQSKSRATIPLRCAICLRMERAKDWLSFMRALMVDGPRQKRNCTDGLSLSKARLRRCLISRLCLAGARWHGPDYRIHEIRAMSAFGDKADMARTCCDVRL